MDESRFFARVVWCAKCGRHPDCSLRYDGAVASSKIECVVCRRCVHRYGTDLEDTAGRVLAAWNDMNTDY